MCHLVSPSRYSLFHDLIVFPFSLSAVTRIMTFYFLTGHEHSSVPFGKALFRANLFFLHIFIWEFVAYILCYDICVRHDLTSQVGGCHNWGHDGDTFVGLFRRMFIACHTNTSLICLWHFSHITYNCLQVIRLSSSPPQHTDIIYLSYPTFTPSVTQHSHHQFLFVEALLFPAVSVLCALSVSSYHWQLLCRPLPFPHPTLLLLP